MSGTVGGAVKAKVEAAGLSLPVFRSRPAPETPMPYAYVTEGVGDVIEPSGDFGAAAPEHREEVQLDVVQALKNPATGAVTERYDLTDGVVAALHGKTLQDVRSGRVWPVRVTAVRRLSSGEKNIVRDTISIVILRSPGSTP